MIRAGLTGSPLDRADALRHDPDRLAAAMTWRARLLVLDGLLPQVDEEGRLGWTSLAEAPDDALLVLLGLDESGTAHFAACPPTLDPAEATPMRSPAMTRALATLDPGEAETYAAARSLILWHAHHRFCAKCGHASEPFRAGWGRRCPHCGTEHFPRVDPVVIMIAEHGGRALLGRGKGWPEGRYSALAGFLEPAESIEEAVAREIREETGVVAHDVRYVASQPWPFASSLMIACVARADDPAIRLDANELDDAMWVSREEVARVLAGEPGPFLPPPPYAIAHTLLTAWAASLSSPRT